MIKVDKKKKIFILYMILFIFIKVDKKIEFTVFFIILVIALKFLQPYISLKWLILKEVRNRKYFFITEKGYISDLKKRREIALFICWVSKYCCSSYCIIWNSLFNNKLFDWILLLFSARSCFFIYC